MSSAHLLGNKLVSSEKPGWVAAAAEGGGVLRQYLQGWGQEQANALALPLQLPDGERGLCALPGLRGQLLTLPAVDIPPQSKALPASELVCPVGRRLSSGSQDHRHLIRIPQK